MTREQAELLAMTIYQNHGCEDLCELSDGQIGFYLIDLGYEDTPENVAKVREA